MNMRDGVRCAVLCLVTISAVLPLVNHSQSPTYEMALAQDAQNDSVAINANKNSMLGELIYESTGKIVSQKVVDTGDINGALAKVELSYSGSGYMQGIGNVTETWTFVNTNLPNNITQGIGKGVIMTDDGNGVATATELGRGFHVSPETIVYPGARVFSTDSNGKLAFLNELVGVTQWEVDSLGNYNEKMWQWK
jgi:hypothetical protein